MYVQYRKMVALGGLIFCSLSASASVIENLSERDWLRGDKALTFDESTGLEWLDINLTSGMSLNQISVSGILNVFRWAMPWEVESLLDAALIGINNRQSTNLDDNDNAKKWINYLGMTGGEEDIRWTQGYTFWRDADQNGATVLQMYGVSTIDCDYDVQYYGSGNSESCISPPTNVIEGSPIYEYELGVFSSFDALIANSSWGLTGPAGAMLVRNALSVDAPEPSVLSMLVLGLAGVGFSRKVIRGR